ncbi:YchJ family protein [Nibricoccus sp. IMCC34717]|uniref:YchJ family protein n=1 Tax=Nibricoccus sp. IMCC34717 TaxID=3034021 RepID=UPI0038517E5E
MLTPPQVGQPCSCGSGQNFEVCCEPVITRKIKAPTAERVMRSRFTAHILDDEQWLHHSYLLTTKKPFKPTPNASPFRWTRLEVHAHEPGATPDQAFVEFSAYYVDTDGSGPEHVLQERSEFRRVDGEWFYAKLVRSGPAPKRTTGPKVGRNDPCPCGSGKKYKSCCLT